MSLLNVSVILSLCHQSYYPPTETGYKEVNQVGNVKLVSTNLPTSLGLNNLENNRFARKNSRAYAS